jgi:hypothetical protein
VKAAQVQRQPHEEEAARDENADLVVEGEPLLQERAAVLRVEVDRRARAAHEAQERRTGRHW